MIVRAVLGRELKKTWRHQGEVVHALIFFLLAVILFPFAIGPDPTLLERVGGGAVWTAALLATSFSLEALFRDDYADGSLELMLLSGAPPALIGLAKALAHWLTAGVPITLLAVPLGAALGLGPMPLAVLALNLALGTLSMSLVGTSASALTVGLRGGGMLVAMLILPLYIPLLIFGASASAHAALGLSAAAESYFLAGLTVLALTLTPWATAAALRIRLA